MGANPSRTMIQMTEQALLSCPTCGGEVNEIDLRTEASRHEAALTGMCADCQDGYFGIEKEAQTQCSCGHSPASHSGDEGYGCDECLGGKCSANKVQPPSDEGLNHYWGQQYPLPGKDAQSCVECGGPVEEDPNSPGVVNHVDEGGQIDHDTDADHQALPDNGRYGSTTTKELPSWIREASVHFEVDASVACEDCGSQSDVKVWMSNHKVCGACRASYEVD